MVPFLELRMHQHRTEYDRLTSEDCKRPGLFRRLLCSIEAGHVWMWGPQESERVDGTRIMICCSCAHRVRAKMAIK